MFLFICIVVFVESTVILANPTRVEANGKSSDINSDVKTKIGKEYIIQYYVKANWYNAYLFCRNNEQSLATINSQEEQDHLVKLINENGLSSERFWISGADLADEGRFSWYPIGKLFKYTNWYDGEPNNFYGNEGCVEVNDVIRGNKWNDRNCTTLQSFVCEIRN